MAWQTKYNLFRQRQYFRWSRSMEKQVQNDEKLNDFLARHQIMWKFNLSQAPWWGGQFECMIGLVKTAVRKTIGNAYLTFDELQEVFLDVEIALNGRPLSH